MGRRILNRKELRNDFDAAERRQQDVEEKNDLDSAEDEEQDEQDEVESDEAESEETDQAEEKAPRKRSAGKTSRPRRARAAKMPRLKVVWGVFNNANQQVAVFEYPQRKEAEELVLKLREEKKSTFFVQPVKEPIEEKSAG
jgi:hypothetical protein